MSFYCYGLTVHIGVGICENDEQSKKNLELCNLRFVFCFLRMNAEVGILVFWHSYNTGQPLFPGSDSPDM